MNESLKIRILKKKGIDENKKTRKQIDRWK